MKPVYLTTIKQDKGSRQIQEDTAMYRSFNEGPNVAHIFILADGVGSTDRGGNASAFISQSMLRWFDLKKRELFISDTQEIIEELKDEIFYIDDILKTRGLEDKHSYGSTLTLVLIINYRCITLQIGDSRAYLAEGKRVCQMEKDQTLYQVLVDHGKEIPPEKEKEYQSTITQCVGTIAKAPKPAITTRLLQDNYSVLLCSDGFYNLLSDEELCSILLSSGNDEKSIQSLIDKVKSKGEEDNISVILHRKEYRE